MMRFDFRAMKHAAIAALLASAASLAVAAESVVDIQSRTGVTQRILYAAPDGRPRAAAILFAGGHGGLSIYPNGSIGWADRSFLVRNRALFVQQGIAVALIDAPSDRRSLSGFRHTPEHATDVKAVIAWLRERTGSAVWLVGHSRGTESAVSTALELGKAPAGPDGLVLASSILTETAFVAGKALTQFPLEKLSMPVLVLHHESDACGVTLPRDLPPFVSRISANSRASVKMFAGGQEQGGLCDVDAHHSFAGQDTAAIDAIIAFMLN